MVATSSKNHLNYNSTYIYIYITEASGKPSCFNFDGFRSLMMVEMKDTLWDYGFSNASQCQPVSKHTATLVLLV